MSDKQWTRMGATVYGPTDDGAGWMATVAAPTMMEAEKVARLMKAAPALLAALRETTEALQHLQDRLYVRVNPPTLQKAHAAITQAKWE